MEKYAVTFTDIALKNLRKIPQKNQKIILINIELLAENPFTKTNVKKLVDFDISYRMRVGNYRVLFERVDNRE